MEDFHNKIVEKLTQKFGSLVKIDFYDERDDGKHFFIKIVSDLFEGKGRVERSQMVYTVLDEFMKNNTIHALRMECKTPSEK